MILPWNNLGEKKRKTKKKTKVKNTSRHGQKNVESGNIFMVIVLFRFVYLYIYKLSLSLFAYYSRVLNLYRFYVTYIIIFKVCFPLALIMDFQFL